MTECDRRIDFLPQLRALLKVSRCLGFTHFTYNPSTRRFEHSKRLYCISRLIFYVGRIASALLALQFTVAFLKAYVFADPGLSDEKLLNQDIILVYNQCYWQYIMTFLITGNYLCYGDIIIPTLNEMLSIFQWIRVRTNAEMYFSQHFEILLALKVCAMTYYLYLQLSSKLFMLLFGDVSGPIGVLLAELTLWSHLLANLVLMCFYLKMNEVLEGHGAQGHIPELIKLSFRIHRVNGTLNRFYTVLYAYNFLGLFGDIMCMCQLFRNLLNEPQHNESPAFQAVFRSVPLAVRSLFSSYDLYLIAYVAELLVDAERRFRTKLLVYSAKVGLEVQSDIELALMQDNILDLSSSAFDLFVIDREFVFKFVHEVVLVNAIAFLQMFMNGRKRAG